MLVRTVPPSSTPPIDVGDVTLVSVTGVNVDAAQRALQQSMQGLRFARVLLISSDPPSVSDPDIERIAIPAMTLAGYSRFILHELHRHIDSAHVLVVQADGYVLNPGRWDPAWLGYDYVGAPWPAIAELDGRRVPLANRVGNGGFSLRSRRLLQLVAAEDSSHVGPVFASEDLFTCFVLYDKLVAAGMRFPTPQVAARFSIETPGATFGQTLRTSFGFHGRHFQRRLTPWWKRLLQR